MPSPLTAGRVVAWGTPGRYLCHGITWPERSPHLALTAPSGAQLLHPLMRPTSAAAAPEPDQQLLIEALDTRRYCLGWMQFTPEGALHRPCPQQVPADRGTQCQHCAAADVFRWAHHAHRGQHAAQVRAELEPYLARAHWVYVATFADATSKVGTAVDIRKVERLDEQGPALATWVAAATDGRSARIVEDLLTTGPLAQTKRHAAKLAAACRPRPVEQVNACHRHAVQQADEILNRTALPGGVTPTDVGERVGSALRDWDPPAAAAALLPQGSAPPSQPYPRPFTSGLHVLQVEAALGSVVRLGASAAGTVADLHSLRGLRLNLTVGTGSAAPNRGSGPLRSGAVTAQQSLF